MDLDGAALETVEVEVDGSKRGTERRDGAAKGASRVCRADHTGEGEGREVKGKGSARGLIAVDGMFWIFFVPREPQTCLIPP